MGLNQHLKFDLVDKNPSLVFIKLVLVITSQVKSQSLTVSGVII